MSTRPSDTPHGVPVSAMVQPVVHVHRSIPTSSPSKQPANYFPSKEAIEHTLALTNEEWEEIKKNNREFGKRYEAAGKAAYEAAIKKYEAAIQAKQAADEAAKEAYEAAK